MLINVAEGLVGVVRRLQDQLEREPGRFMMRRQTSAVRLFNERCAA